MNPPVFAQRLEPEKQTREEGERQRRRRGTEILAPPVRSLDGGGQYDIMSYRRCEMGREKVAALVIG